MAPPSSEDEGAMAKTLSILLVLASTAMAAQQEPPAAVPRVRSANPAIAALITTGMTNSRTFRSIIERINASDGVVYVEEGDCRNAVRGCLRAVAKSAANRIVLVHIRLAKSDCDVVATIGHELQHALEILNDPAVTDSAAMYRFYTREARRRLGGGFETAAAVKAEQAVHAEMRSSIGR